MRPFVPVLFGIRQRLRRAAVYYARNIDQLVLALISRILFNRRAVVIYEILDVQLQVDLGPRQVRALAEPGQRGRVDLAAGVTQQPGHLGPAPAAVPGAVNEDELLDGHVS